MSDSVVPRGSSASPPGSRPTSLEAPHTEEELAWWKVERRKHRWRSMLGGGLTIGIPLAGLQLVRQGLLAPLLHPTPAVIGDLLVFLAIWIGSGALVGGSLSWWMTEASARDNAIRGRRVNQAMLE
jgi:hypothetical protein